MTTTDSTATPARAPGTVPALVGRTFDQWIADNRTPQWVAIAAQSRTVEEAMRLAYAAGVAANASGQPRLAQGDKP